MAALVAAERHLWLTLPDIKDRDHRCVGVKTERQEECAFSITENHLYWCGVGFDQDAGTYVPCSYRVNPHGMSGE